MQVESLSPRLMPVNRDGKSKTACHTTEQVHDSRAGVFPSARAGWAASAAAWKQSDARSRVPRGIVFEVDLLRLNHVSNLQLTQPKPATASVARAPLGAQSLPVLLSTEARASSITVHDSASPDWINQSVVDYLLAQGAGEKIHGEPRDRGVATQTLRADAASASPDCQHGSLRIERSAQQCGHTALRPRDSALWSSARSQAATTRAGDKDHVPNGRGAKIEGVGEGRRDWQVRGKAVDWQVRGKAVDMTKWHSGEHIEGWPQAPVTEIIDHALSLYTANDVLFKTPQPTDAQAGAVKTTLVPIGSACNTPRLTPEVIMTCAPDSARICADIGLSILGAWHRHLSILAPSSTQANPLCSSCLGTGAHYAT